MLVEYIGSKANKLRWKTEASSLGGDDSDLICYTATWDSQPKNKVTVWLFAKAEGVVEVKRQSDITVTGNATKMVVFGEDMMALTTSDDQLHLYSCQTSMQLNQTKKWINLHGDSCDDLVFNKFNGKLMTCGSDGRINYFDMEKLDAEQTKTSKLTENSARCIDVISPNEVICGTESGHIKIYDCRKDAVAMSMINNSSMVSCVECNPNLSHVVACGNESGLLSMWDLRNNATHLMQSSAHNSLLTELHFKQNEPNIVVTSSLDGQLLKWQMSPIFQVVSVDSVFGKTGDAPINSFHINSGDEIIFCSDDEILCYGHV